MLAKGFTFNRGAFILGFLVGIIYVFIASPDITSAVTYPTPYNAGKIIYKDAANNCFTYVATKVMCPSKNSGIKTKSQPISTST
jgi:hypothetical protein